MIFSRRILQMSLILVEML